MDISQREARIQTICLFIIATIGVAFALHWLKPVMIPFVLALVFSFVLTPLIDLQKKYLRMPHVLAVLITLLLALVLLTIIGLLITASINEMTANADLYQARISQLFQKLSTSLDLQRFGLDIQQMFAPMLNDLGNNVGGMVVGTINTLLKLLSKSILILIFVLFILIGQPKNRKVASGNRAELEKPVKRYIVTKIIISSITGLLVGTILGFLGIDLALVFGLLAFLLNFIPSIGSIIATLLPLPVVLFSPEISGLTAILAIGIPGVLQFTIGNVIEPKVMGDSLDLHPVTILMALIFWGMIWGVVGMLLAAPLTAIMKIIFTRMEFTSPLANLLGGRLDSE